MRIALLVVLLAAPLLLTEASIIHNSVAKLTNVMKNVKKVVTSPLMSVFAKKEVAVTDVPEFIQNPAFDPLTNPEINDRINEINSNNLEEGHSDEEHAEGEHAQEEHAEEHSTGHHFGYDEADGPANWPKTFPTCGGLRQSPINFVENKLVPAPEGESIEFLNMWQPANEMTVANNGHAATYTGKWDADKRPMMTSGPLGEDTYAFEQAHFHWGLTDDAGSEHRVNGEPKSGEFHFVYSNLKYGGMTEAQKHPDGLAVLGYFIAIGKEENPMMEYFIRDLDKIEGSENTEVKMEPVPLNALGLSDPISIMSYPGSLTTPPCLEVVTWLMAEKPIKVSEDQMAVMRNIVKNSHGEHMENFRNAQKMNGRVVTRYTQKEL